jgi:hypothetical protein
MICFFFVILQVLIFLSVSVNVMTGFVLCVLEEFEYEKVLSSCCNV